jgi:ankyrin repeat protein
VVLLIKIDKYERFIQENNAVRLKREIEKKPEVIHFKDEFDRSLLLLAILHGSCDSVVVLVDSGMDINQLNKGGQSALMYAAFYNRLEIAEYLLDKGAMVSTRTYRKDESALGLAMKRDEKKDHWVLLFNSYRDQLDEKDLELLYENRLVSLFLNDLC